MRNFLRNASSIGFELLLLLLLLMLMLLLLLPPALLRDEEEEEVAETLLPLCRYTPPWVEELSEVPTDGGAATPLYSKEDPGG